MTRDQMTAEIRFLQSQMRQCDGRGVTKVNEEKYRAIVIEIANLRRQINSL